MSNALVRRSPLHRARVLAVRDLTPRMRSVTVQADSMIDVMTRPAQDVELFLREESGRRVKRRYTIRRARPETGELELDVLIHGHGPGSAWGAAVVPGDFVDFQGPRGKLHLTPADWHLLVGDESALPAVASLCEALPETEPAIAVLEIGDPSDILPMPSATQVHWMQRALTLPGSAELLAAAVRGLDLPVGSGHGYLMGETRAMVTLRSVLEARGLAHDAIFVKGYWNVGRPDRIAGRSPGALPEDQ